jgi:hypothetical protein
MSSGAIANRSGIAERQDRTRTDAGQQSTQKETSHEADPRL